MSVLVSTPTLLSPMEYEVYKEPKPPQRDSELESFSFVTVRHHWLFLVLLIRIYTQSVPHAREKPRVGVALCGRVRTWQLPAS